MKIKPGISVVAASGGKATLGTFFGVEGTWFSFVPGHTFGMETIIRAAATRKEIGQIVQSSPEPDDWGVFDVVDSLRLVKLAVKFAPEITRLTTTWRDPIECLGQRVLKPADTRTMWGTVVGVDGPFCANQQDAILRYMGGFEVESDGETAAFAAYGDGGSAIMDTDGRLVGVLVGVTGKRFYCVPAQSIIERHWPDVQDLVIAPTA